MKNYRAYFILPKELKVLVNKNFFHEFYFIFRGQSIQNYTIKMFLVLFKTGSKPAEINQIRNQTRRIFYQTI